MENLMIALQITVVGMGLVFGAIILLWGLMALLVRLGADRPSAAPAEGSVVDETGLKEQAAIAAVSIALARHADTEPHEFPLPPTPLVSAWQAVMRSNMLNKRGSRR